jgi:hypothetical protein
MAKIKDAMLDYEVQRNNELDFKYREEQRDIEIAKYEKQIEEIKKSQGSLINNVKELLNG